MAIFKVEGGHRLHGSITPQGAKNEALQILCATLLTPERVTISNIPRILDVLQLIELLRRMGVEVEQLADDTYSFRARDIDFDYLRTDDYRQRCTRLRGSVMLIGPMLARFGMGFIPARRRQNRTPAPRHPLPGIPEARREVQFRRRRRLLHGRGRRVARHLHAAR